MYWPGELRVPVQYGDTGIVVEMTSKSALLHHTVRTFDLCLVHRAAVIVDHDNHDNNDDDDENAD